MLQLYAGVRGPYLTATLQNLAAASVNTAKKKTPDALYRQGTNGMGAYAKGMEGAFLAEYDNICALFSRDEWGKGLQSDMSGSYFGIGKDSPRIKFTYQGKSHY
jgi:exocyst complex protein 7